MNFYLKTSFCILESVKIRYLSRKISTVKVFSHTRRKTLLQHLVAIIGGFIDLSWHILHWNASLTSFAIPSGKGKDLLTSSISATMDEIYVTSAVSFVMLSFARLS